MTNSLIASILEELKTQMIIQEHDGLYEIKHDVVASKINEKRITEDNNSIEAARIVYETYKNHGVLTAEQLIKIEPYLNTISFLENDKESLNKYIKDCRAKIEFAAEKEKELTANALKAEREARASATIAQKAEMEARASAAIAQMAEGKATKSAETAIKRRNIARIFAALVILISLVALFFLLRERTKTLELSVNNTKTIIESSGFDSAYNSLKDIQAIRNFAPGFMTKQQVKDDLKFLNQVLLFHVTATRIKTARKYILIADDKRIIIKEPNNYKLQDKEGFFFDSVFKSTPTFFELSAITDDFVIAGPDSIKKLNNIMFYTVDTNNQHATGKLVDEAEVVTADFDSQGRLYYLKGESMYVYDKNKERVTRAFGMNNYLKNKDPHNFNLHFLLKEDMSPSDYIVFSCSDVSNTGDLIININSFEPFNLPKEAKYAIDSNRYLFYCFLDKDNKVPVFRKDLQDKPGRKGQLLASIDNISQFDQIISGYLTNKKGTDAKEVSSGDKKKSISYDPIKSSIEVKSAGSLVKKIKIDSPEKIYAYEALDAMFVYICITPGGSENIYFCDYLSDKKNKFQLAPKWKFIEFKNKKYMLFQKGEGPYIEKSLLIIDPYMFEGNYFGKWFSAKN